MKYNSYTWQERSKSVQDKKEENAKDKNEYIAQHNQKNCSGQARIIY